MIKNRVMLVDDPMLLREGLKTIIDLQDDMEVECEAENGKTAVEKIAGCSPDVILMDIRMPEMDGVEATSIIKRENPEVSIIILTTFVDDEYIVEALSNGPDGYLLKDIDALHLVRAIQDANNGVLMMPARIAVKLAVRIAGNQGSVQRMSSMINENDQGLTDREK